MLDSKQVIWIKVDYPSKNLDFVLVEFDGISLFLASWKMTLKSFQESEWKDKQICLYSQEGSVF